MYILKKGATIIRQHHNCIQFQYIYKCYCFLIQFLTFLCLYPTLC